MDKEAVDRLKEINIEREDAHHILNLLSNKRMLRVLRAFKLPRLSNPQESEVFKMMDSLANTLTRMIGTYNRKKQELICIEMCVIDKKISKTDNKIEVIDFINQQNECQNLIDKLFSDPGNPLYKASDEIIEYLIIQSEQRIKEINEEINN